MVFLGAGREFITVIGLGPMQMVDLQDSQLLRAVQGDQVALKALLAQSRDQLHQYLSGKIPADLSSVVDADDLVQEVHIRVFQNIGSLESDRPEAFHRWVKVIAINELRRAIRRCRAGRRGGGRIGVGDRKKSIEESTIGLLNLVAAPGKRPSQSVACHEAIEAVEVALSALPAHYEKALRLIHLQSCTLQEAAIKMGRSERAVQGLCRRGLKRLQRRLGNASRFLSSAG